MDERLVVEITAEIGKLKEELDNAKREIENFGNSGERKMSNFNEAMSTVGATANKAVGIAAGALAGAATALLGVSTATAEYRANQDLLNSAFATAGASAETAKQTYNDLFRVLADDGSATETAQQLAQITTEEKALGEYTTILTGVYAQWGASIDSAGLAEAINHTSELGSVQGTLADALEWSGVSVDDFNEQLAACNDTAEREALIRSTLGDLYGEAAANYEETAATTLAQNEAQLGLNDSMAALGEAVAPVITALTDLATTLLEQLSPVIEDFMTNYGSQLEQSLVAIGEAAGVVIDFIVSNIETISLIAGIIMAIVVAINLYNAAMAIFNIVMSPVNLIILAIVAAILALIAIIYLCITHWDEIKAAAISCWEWIKETWNTVATWFDENVIQPIVEFFTNLWNGIVDIFNSCKEWFTEKFNSAKEGITNAFSSIGSFFSGIWSSITSIFSKVGTWFREKFQQAKNNVVNAFSTIGSFFSGIWENIKSIFSSVGTAIADGIRNAVSTAVNAVLSTACNIINGFISAINFAIGIINAIPGVSIGYINELSVPEMAKGGVVNSATLAVIGEDGTEAVLPLEKNLGYLDKLAELITGRMGGNNTTPVVLNVDGKVFAQTAINTINRQTRETGQLALNIV